MPYDSFGFKDLEVPVSKPFDFDAATPDERLLELARLLENEQEWRDRLIGWNFEVILEGAKNSCGTAGCAVGLAETVWGDRFLNIYGAFDLCGSEAFDIFGCGLADGLGLEMSEVQPIHVATAIREFVAKRNPPPQES